MVRFEKKGEENLTKGFAPPGTFATPPLVSE